MSKKELRREVDLLTRISTHDLNQSSGSAHTQNGLWMEYELGCLDAYNTAAGLLGRGWVFAR